MQKVIILFLILLLGISGSLVAGFMHAYALCVLFIAIILLTLAEYSFSRKTFTDNSCTQIASQLKETQAQLVMQEKMASIGMLSAGIAHEIKNPLNFINNFSDMTKGLLEELKVQLATAIEKAPPNTKEDLNFIIDDIITNCTKINEHGKRAESIIKNMLLQARTADVEKTPVNINALLEEFLNLSYHGMRAQNTNFNAKIEKNLDPSLPAIMGNVQNIGRVFLNIINNGLYAANERRESQKEEFMPIISVFTSQNEKNIIIKIRDNGKGIPENLRAKIFEPFFTTKPAAHGTGLGLPMCYDIVVKEHGGTLEVESKPEEYTEFIIMLPK